MWESQQRTCAEGSLWNRVSIHTQQQLARGLFSPWEFRVTQPSWSFCDSAQTKDRMSYTPAQSAEPDPGFGRICLFSLSSLEDGGCGGVTKVPPCLASLL